MDLKGLDRTELHEFVERLGEKKYRAQQIYEWLYSKQIESFEDMTNISKGFRARMMKNASIGTLRLSRKQQSLKDRSVKFLFELKDGAQIESVLMFNNGRATLCLSTQVGCAIDCTFCATGMMGFTRNLTTGEIVDQFIQVQKMSDAEISNVVFMGMGEPFHNYENLIKACKIMTDDQGINLSARHLVVSTSGLAPKIRQFADEKHKFRLALSLNATTDRQRSQLMPITKKWPIAELLKAARYYVGKSNQAITIEYIMLKDINDSEEDAIRLRSMVDGLLCKINLIPYNPTKAKYQRSPKEQILLFYGKLADLKMPVTIRWSKGDDIDAGCGQLAANEQA